VSKIKKENSMDELYICPSCGMQYTLDDLEDNDDGICPSCGCPLESSCGFESYSYVKPLVQGNNGELNTMLDNLKNYPMDEIWHEIELLKNWKERVKGRTLFFKALKILGKEFELWDN
jgi:hypothetical protein